MNPLRTRPNGANGSRQTGATLIEVLVAIIVLSIGLLGLAGLQTQSLRSGHSAHIRSQATLLALDMADRMRARVGSDAAGADLVAGQYSDGSADDDRVNWDAVVAIAIPGALGSVTRPDAVARPRFFAIAITWSDERGCIKDDAGACTEAGAAAQTFTYETEI